MVIKAKCPIFNRDIADGERSPVAVLLAMAVVFFVVGALRFRYE